MIKNKLQQITSRAAFLKTDLFQNTVAVLFLLYMVFYTIFPIFGDNFDRIPGDLTDARFNNYLLENGYSYLTNKEHVFWNAPFCYPEKEIISYSDNFIGELPLYAAFRVCGMDNQSAYQGWMVVTLLLNFIVCAWVLFRLSGNKLAALAGAFVFTFAIPVFDQNYHSQMMARYMLPLAFYFLIMLLKEAKHKYVFFLLLSIVLQFYNSIYLGLLLSLGLFCALLGYSLFYWKSISFRTIFKRKYWRWYTLYCMINFGLLFLIMWPYIERSMNGTLPDKAFVMASLPEPSAYLLTCDLSSSWTFLDKVPQGMIDFWNKFLFPGGMASLSVVVFLVILLVAAFRRKIGQVSSLSRLGLAFLSGFILLFILTFRVGKFSLYEGVYYFPGFAAMRDLCRVVNVQLLYYAILVTFMISMVLAKIRYTWLRNGVGVLLLVLVVIDNRYDSEKAVTYSKEGSQEEVMDLVDKITSHPDYRKYEAVVYMPDTLKGSYSPIQLDAMLASQYLGIKTVNGYTGTCPVDYCNFGVKPDTTGLKIWLTHNGLPADSTVFLFIH
jgi:hypothetical protein